MSAKIVLSGSRPYLLKKMFDAMFQQIFEQQFFKDARSEPRSYARQPVYIKQADGQVFLFLSIKSRQVSLDRLFSGPIFRQKGRIGLKDR